MKRFTSAAILCLLLVSCGPPQEGHGTYESDDGIYVGEVKAGKAHGQGTMTGPDGSKYVGEWRSGKEWEGVEYLVSGDVGGIYAAGKFCEGCIEQALPYNGAINNALIGERIARLKVNTKGESNYLVKLAPFSSTDIGMTIFIRAGESMETKVPIGSYEFRYASGQKWYGYENRFGPTTAYYKGEGVMHFTKTKTSRGYSILGHAVTLYAVSDGNYETEEIDEKKF